MVKVDVAKFLVSFFTFCTILRVLYLFNKDAILFTAELLKEAFGVLCQVRRKGRGEDRLILF